MKYSLLVLAVLMNYRLSSQNVIWSDDLSDPGSWNTAIWPGAPNTPWVIGTEPAQGSIPLAEIQSTTAANGYALLDSDFYGDESSTETESSTLTTAFPIDLSSEPNVLLEFETFYRKWQYEECYVVISTNGIDWPALDPDIDVSSNPNVFKVFPGMASQWVMNNPTKIRLNISNIAGGQPQVWVRFHWTGVWGYAWYVDDVAIVQQPEHDLELLDAGPANNNGGILYGRIPVSQIGNALQINARILNFGHGVPSNAQLHVDITDPNGTSVFADDLGVPSIFPSDTLFTSQSISPGPLSPALYTIVMEVSSDEEQSGSMTWNDNSIEQRLELTTDRYSLDNLGNHLGVEQVSAMGTNSFGNNEDGMMMMTQYHVTTPLMVHGIEVMLETGTLGTQPGGLVMAHIHDSLEIFIDQFTFTPNLADPLVELPALYTITPADISAGKLELYFQTPVTLQPGSFYAAIEAYGSGIDHRIRIKDDLTIGQPDWASLIYLPFAANVGAEENRIYSNGNAFAIRLITDTTSTAEPCEALFTVTQGLSLPDSLPVPGLLWITDASSGGSGIYDYTWDMGDGTIYNEPTPYHDYATNGPYDLCLTINDDQGCTDTYCDEIWVDDQGIVFGFTFDGSRSEGFGVQILSAPTVSIASELTLTDRLIIWPNPALDQLTVPVNDGDGSLVIIDALGRQMIEHQIPAVDKMTIDVSDLASGTYHVQISGRTRSSASFVKLQ